MRILVLLAAAAAALLVVTQAFAHAEPARVTPGDGAVLALAPKQVAIDMSQEMARQAGANDIEVFDASGRKVTTAAATVDNADRKRITVPLPADLPTGTYQVRWKTLSADDGDAASGSFSFTIDPQRTPTAGTEVVRPDILNSGGSTPEASPAATVKAIDGGGDSGPGWTAVVAVGVATLVVGSGGTYFLVQRRP